MIALDTNVLLRFMLDDDPAQSPQAHAVMRRAEQSGEQLLVPLLVVLEFVWVLERVARLARHDTIRAVELLSRMPPLHFEREAVVRRFVREAAAGRGGLADYLIGLSAAEAGAETVWTLDRDAVRTGLFRPLLSA